MAWPEGLAALAGWRVRSLGYSCRAGRSGGTALLTRSRHGTLVVRESVKHAPCSASELPGQVSSITSWRARRASTESTAIVPLAPVRFSMMNGSVACGSWRDHREIELLDARRLRGGQKQAALKSAMSAGPGEIAGQ
jgi:hypothetical protein